MNAASDILKKINRGNLDRFVTGELWGGHDYRANLKILNAGGEKFVLKDFSGKGFFARAGLAEILIGHEWRIYRKLRGIPGIPRVLRRMDGESFIMEYIEARPLKDFKYERVSPLFIRRLEELVAAMHSRGVLHMDLKQRRNILVAPDDRPYLIDFATAVYLGASAFSKEVLIPFFGRFDWSGVYKVKKWHAPETLTDAEAKTLRRMEKMRRLWFFTPVHVSKRKPPCSEN